MEGWSRRIAFALAANQIVAAIVAVRHDIPGRPLGVAVHWPRSLELTFWGTGISAPFALAAVLAIAAGRDSVRSARLVRGIGATVLAGQLVEPVVWRKRDPLAARIVIATNLALTSALAAGRGR